MPQRIIRELSARVLRFLTPVPWSKLGFFSHVGAVYGLRTQLRDLRWSNVAALLSSFSCHNEVTGYINTGLRLVEQQRSAGRQVSVDQTNPADIYIRAHN